MKDKPPIVVHTGTAGTTPPKDKVYIRGNTLVIVRTVATSAPNATITIGKESPQEHP